MAHRERPAGFDGGGSKAKEADLCNSSEKPASSMQSLVLPTRCQWPVQTVTPPFLESNDSGEASRSMLMSFGGGGRNAGLTAK
jgi:hypothetical protein